MTTHATAALKTHLEAHPETESIPIPIPRAARPRLVLGFRVVVAVAAGGGAVAALATGCVAAGSTPAPRAGADPHLEAAAAPARSPAALKPDSGAGLGLRPAQPAIVGTLSSQSSRPLGDNLLWNGAFDGEGRPAEMVGEDGDRPLRPWSLAFDSPRNGHRVPADGELCLRVEEPGVHSFDVALRQSPLALVRGHAYQFRLRTHATVATGIRATVRGVGLAARDYWTATLASRPETATLAGTWTFDGPADDGNAEVVLEFGGPLAVPAPFTVCVADVELNDPAFTAPAERTARTPRPRVRVNQVGYLPGLAKHATFATLEPGPLTWQLVTAKGKVEATGQTQPFGVDRSSGERVHVIDFSSVTTPGTRLRLRVGAESSGPFDIVDVVDVVHGVYRRLKYDALAFFYLQRSGVDIRMPFAGSPAYARPAGHLGDRSVPCAPEAHCTYSLDVSGGWYDAGDHGKYVVNSGISVWTLQNQFEALCRFGVTVGDFADGRMNIPEAGNGRPDLLDEARFNLEFMLRMQVPAGQPHAGMVHQRIHGEAWSPIPTMPDRDDIKRFLHPVSTAATYDLAATAAQGARLWKALDPPFAARCLTAAETAFAAARATPTILAEPLGQGGGAYGDGDIEDERYWAAAELFVTTLRPAYREELVRSRFHASRAPDAAGGVLGWDHVAALGKISLAEAAGRLGGAEAEAEASEARAAILAAADRLVETIARRGYRVPAASDRSYVWGSNGGVLNAALVMGTASLLCRGSASGEAAATRYANGVVDSLDYILGRNPLAHSYVAGYGTDFLRNPHHRVWAHQKDPKLPEAPPGAVSGGPNSMLQDPYIRTLGMAGCPPQTCYVDHVDSYSTNEVAINWNAPLAWDAAFLDDVARRAAPVARRADPATRP